MSGCERAFRHGAIYGAVVISVLYMLIWLAQ
jgi:hypothetical protein